MKREYYTTTHTNYMIYKMENKMLFKKKKTNKKYMMINVQIRCEVQDDIYSISRLRFPCH